MMFDATLRLYFVLIYSSILLVASLNASRPSEHPTQEGKCQNAWVVSYAAKTKHLLEERCLCVQKVVYILEVQLWYSCFRNYNCQYLWVSLVVQYRVTSVYFIAVYHECVLRKGSKNTPNFDSNVV